MLPPPASCLETWAANRSLGTRNFSARWAGERRFRSDSCWPCDPSGFCVRLRDSSRRLFLLPPPSSSLLPPSSFPSGGPQNVMLFSCLWHRICCIKFIPHGFVMVKTVRHCHFEGFRPPPQGGLGTPRNLVKPSKSGGRKHHSCGPPVEMK